MTNPGNKNILPQPGYPLLYGANKIADGYNFAVEAEEESQVSLLFYKKKEEAPFWELELDGKYRTGRVFSVFIKKLNVSDLEYNFKIDGKVIQDPCAHRIIGREEFGVLPEDSPHKVRCGFLSPRAFDWENETAPELEYENMILYKVHVRGYTKQAKLPASVRGTFLGLTRMIPYWKELGINAVELMPAYEFEEISAARQEEGLVALRSKETRINYWGYTSGYYFAPKSSYCATRDPEKEFREMIKAFHSAGIACIMEMYFPENTGIFTALQALQFWKRHYHVDGFHVLGEGVSPEILMRDGVLAGTKILASGMDTERFYRGKIPPHRCFGEYNLGFLQDMRRFLKSDEDMVPAVQYRIQRNPDDHGVVNYITCQDGFTLNDLVSYNYKHNEANGENNEDGSCYNYSWNCGVEGPSRKLALRQMRERQMRAAFAMMLLSQGTPMLYGGDEIGNSQDGNNNAYCQDNPTGWINWKEMKRNASLLAFVKKAIAFRKAHPVLHTGSSMKEADYLGKGFPDLSFHGERAWFSNLENTSRMLGMMLCGEYSPEENGKKDDFIYVGYNFHWEPRNMALPNLPEGMKWKKVMDTEDLSCDGFYGEEGEICTKTVKMGPRTVTVLIGVGTPVPKAVQKAGKKAPKEASAGNGSDRKAISKSKAIKNDRNRKDRRQENHASVASL